MTGSLGGTSPAHFLLGGIAFSAVELPTAWGNLQAVPWPHGNLCNLFC